MSTGPSYVGRFAPSPSGPLHRGSIVAAMASYLDAKAHGGRWLLRIEDIDRSRSRPEASQQILNDLSKLGFRFEAGPWFQSLRSERYQAAFEKLQDLQLVYPCVCSRKEIEDSRSTSPNLHSNASIYPGTCRLGFDSGRPLYLPSVRAWRLALQSRQISWQEGDWLKASKQRTALTLSGRSESQNAYVQAGDVQADMHQEEITLSVGDFVIARPGSSQDGVNYAGDSRNSLVSPKTVTPVSALEWTYQLSVVVDDEESGVTHVVRGMDLLDSTSRQIYLQEKLAYRRLRYWHCPLVLEPDGQKISKQNGAQAINSELPIAVLNQGLLDLGLPGLSTSQLESMNLAQFWESSILKWRELMLRKPDAPTS